MWPILCILAAVGLIIFWRGPNAVWGAIALGFISGAIAQLISLLRGNGFHWAIVGKWIVVFVLCGIVFELIWLATNRKRKS